MTNSQLPLLLKYMGSKREILSFIIAELDALEIHADWFCDLFAGTSVVGCSLKDRFSLHLNDVQDYSSIFSHIYLIDLKRSIEKSFITELQEKVMFLVDEFYSKYPELKFNYSKQNTLNEVLESETRQREFMNKKFDIGFHLFTKFYSGTYWSCEQCVLIDSIRATAESYKGKPEYYAILSALIYAMSYTSQGTGHFAQYRDMCESNFDDIMIYRCRKLWLYFKKKFLELIDELDSPCKHTYRITSLDYTDCLRIINKNSIVYADPPYSAVHYSRFYHAIETLVKYDYPEVKYKGRYRENRHQSAFCKKTEIEKAFVSLFEGIKSRKSHLILSYSDNGMISRNKIMSIADKILGNNYVGKISSKEYVHSKMGRSDESCMNVKELLISYKRV